MADGNRTPKDADRDTQANPPADEHEETVRKGYEAALEPEKQGDGDPGTEPPGDNDPQPPA
jgi:hypothetical protein